MSDRSEMIRLKYRVKMLEAALDEERKVSAWLAKTCAETFRDVVSVGWTDPADYLAFARTAVKEADDAE